jgi:hypothetical protein
MAYSDTYSDIYDSDVVVFAGAAAGSGSATRLTWAGPPMSTIPYPSWIIAVDWNGDGFFTGTDIITSDVLSRLGIAIQYGRDQARALNPAQPGQATFGVNNVSQNYSPEHPGSPFAELVPGRPFIVQATWSGATYTLYQGNIDDFNVLPNWTDLSVEFSCLDIQSNFAAVTLSTPLYNGLSSGQAIGVILDAVGWPSGPRDLDVGASQFRWWWEEGTDGWTALQKVLASEGPPAIAYIDESTGNFVYRDRMHRAVRSQSNSSQATFTNATGGAEPRFSMPFTYDNAWKNIINQVIIPVDERNPPDLASPEIGGLQIDWPSSGPGEITPVPPVVWQSTAITFVPAGTNTTIAAAASDPFFNAEVRAICISGAVTASLSRTSGQSTIVLLENTGGDAIVSMITIYANPVPVTETVQITASDTGSITQYGLRSLPGVAQATVWNTQTPTWAQQAPVWANQNDAAAIASLIITQRAHPLPDVQMRVVNANTIRLQQQLYRALSDRITIQDIGTGLDADFFIEQIGHTISQGGRIIETIFGCEKVVNMQPAGLFRFDDPVYGQFDTGGVFGI